MLIPEVNASSRPQAPLASVTGSLKLTHPEKKKRKLLCCAAVLVASSAPSPRRKSSRHMQTATTARGTSGVAKAKAVRTLEASKTHCKANAFCTSAQGRLAGMHSLRPYCTYLNLAPSVPVASTPVNCRTSIYDTRVSPGLLHWGRFRTVQKQVRTVPVAASSRCCRRLPERRIPQSRAAPNASAAPTASVGSFSAADSLKSSPLGRRACRARPKAARAAEAPAPAPPAGGAGGAGSWSAGQRTPTQAWLGPWPLCLRQHTPGSFYVKNEST